MTGIYAPTTRARRVFIALLAFALAIALAIVATAAPADAARDKKEYSAEVGTPPDSVAVVLAGPGSGTTVTFTNVSSTSTQLAGSFSVTFPAAVFTNVSATDADVSNPNWHVVSTLNNTVIISANSGGHRIGINETVVVDVAFDAPTATGSHPLDTAADQQAGGVFSGGNEFKLVGPEPTLVIATACERQQCAIDNLGQPWTADLGCGLPCGFITNPGPSGGFFADFEVFIGEGGTIILVLTTDGKGSPPGKTSVTVDGKTLPDCGVSGSETNCVHINRVIGDDGKQHTEYQVFWDGDPRFRFR